MEHTSQLKRFRGKYEGGEGRPSRAGEVTPPRTYGIKDAMACIAASMDSSLVLGFALTTQLLSQTFPGKAAG